MGKHFIFLNKIRLVDKTYIFFNIKSLKSKKINICFQRTKKSFFLNKSQKLLTPFFSISQFFMIK
jgi:hypothetical protein